MVDDTNLAPLADLSQQSAQKDFLKRSKKK
jgi:hypothetical protein